MKKLPPYGTALYTLQKSGHIPTNTINIWIGARAWKKGEAFSMSYPARTIVLPPWEDATKYFWPVTKCDVLIHDTSGADQEYIDDLVWELYRSGADIVRYLAPCLTLSVYHNGSVSYAC